MEHGSIWILVAIVGAFGLLLSRKRFRNAFYRWAEYKLSVRAFFVREHTPYLEAF